ncbi:MAG: hypothetical protein LQ347_002117 [Umbilicaria vellea]|nr:MAG: hypothetical protein LQ347_002117 [Umbilicaria vellea]
MASTTMDAVLTEGTHTDSEAPSDSSLDSYNQDLAASARPHANHPPRRETQPEPKHDVQQSLKATLAETSSNPKLRPALDVLNRLRYDPDFDDEDYVVGYRDRHDGVQELCASLWKSETSDEEFIPQHRIKYFKRKSDNMVVWDRFMRLDLIFGSGIKQKAVIPDVSDQHPPPPPPPLAPPDEDPAPAAAAAAAAPPSPPEAAAPSPQ